MYMSMTIGNIVDTKKELVQQMFESIFKYHIADFRWKKYDETLWGEL